MPGKRLPLAGLLACAAVILAGCGTPRLHDVPPATVTRVPGSRIPRLELTGRAVQRLGLTTRPVRLLPGAAGRAVGGARARTVIPYSAVVYDTNGSTWTYLQTAPRTYRRQPVTIATIRGSVAVLSSGPPVGAAVVTVGAAELLGTEYNISGEQ